MTLAAATVLTIISTATFFVLERVRPGRALPKAPGWYGRALAINLCQIGFTLVGNKIWNRAFANQASLVHLSAFNAPLLEGFVGWLVGTFVFYWWHRIRHANGFWQVFHQVHHSPSRIEVILSRLRRLGFPDAFGAGSLRSRIWPACPFSWSLPAWRSRVDEPRHVRPGCCSVQDQ